MAGTSLAEQLKKLAVPQTSILVHSKKRSSLLFDPKEAANITRDTFYQIGLSGLEELKSIDSRLAEFEKSLFNETSQHLERAVEDQQANAKLDQLINRFLFLLSPYVNINATHKALEWLICRFHIHEYNPDSILSLFLPYHDTNIFARMVQILPLEGKGGRWLWLQPLKKEGIPMSKGFLLSRAANDTSFFKFICNLPLQGIQVHGEKSYCLTTLFAFYCTTVIGALDLSTQVTEVQVTHLLPSLTAGINSSNIDFTAAAFMILGHLVSKIRLTAEIFSELFYKVCRSEQKRLRSEAVLVLVVMAQSGRTLSVLPAIPLLASIDWFLPNLTHLADSGVVVFPLVATIIADSLLAMKSPENVQVTELQHFVTNLIKDLSFNNEEAEKIFKIFAEMPFITSEWYTSMIRQLEKSYPEAFDETVKSHSSVLSLVMPGHSSRNDLFLLLNHPKTKMRLEAVHQIHSQKSLLKEEWIQEALLSRLGDDSKSVVEAVLELADNLRVPESQLKEHLTSVISRSWQESGKFYSLGTVALNHLTPDTPLLLLLVLPYLFPTNPNELSTAESILNCPVVKQCNLFQPLYKDLENVPSEDTFCKAVYKFIRTDLKCMDINDMLEAGKQMRSHSAVYKFLTMIIISCILPEEVPLTTLKSIINSITEYNSSKINSKIKKDLSEENLAELVTVCRNGKGAPFQGSLELLKVVVEKVMKSFMVGSKIYNVKDPHMVLLIDMFKIILEMKNHKSKIIREAYSSYSDNIFEPYENKEEGMNLICNLILGSPELMADCMQRLQDIVGDITDISEHVLVPTLLVTLRSESDNVRHLALSVLQSLTQKLALPTYHKLLDHLNGYSHEIQVDHEQLSIALYMSLSPDPTVQSLLQKSQRLEMSKILNSLIDIVIAPDTPVYMRSSLLMSLDQINSQDVLRKLVPLAVEILQSEECSLDNVNVLQSVIKRVNVTTATAFADILVWDFVEACFRSQKVKAGCVVPAVLIFQQIDRELFSALSTDQQHRLLNLIISCVADTEQSDVTGAATSCFKRIVLDSNIVAKLLESMRDATVSVSSESTKKRGWTVKKPPPLQLLTSTPWKQGLCLLEFIQNKKKLENVQALLPILFEILNRCLQFEEQSPVEYTKQVLLTSLLHCCMKVASGGSIVDLPESSVPVELVVECVRVSSNPQTHHHALLLLAHIANMIPDKVLHSIMPIFTFMGSSVLRQDDAYSFQIISKIVETIIPIILQNDSDEEELSSEVVEVLRVFAGALIDIPEHRRIPLFSKLMITLDQGRLLWVFLSLIFESHVLNQTSDNTNGKESGTIPKKLEVGLNLCYQFPISTILTASCRLIHYLHVFPVEKDNKKIQTFKKSKIGALFDVERATGRQLRYNSYTTLTFLSYLLSSKQFVSLIAALNLEEMKDLEEIFQQILKGILTFTQDVSKQVDLNKGQPAAKYWNTMFTVSFDVLGKVNALLPGDMFLSVISSLLHHELVSLRVKALELLNWRLQQTQTQQLDSALLLNMLPTLLNLIKNDSQLVQQTALLSIKFLARQLATDHPDEFQGVFKAATKLVKKRNHTEPVLCSAVLCVGELCHTLRAHAIASLPTFMPSIISILENHDLVESGDLLLMSVVSALYKIVDSLVCFLSPYLAKLLEQLCILSANCARHRDNPKLQPVIQKIKTIRQKISGDVDLRVLLPAVAQSYSQLITGSQTAALPALLSLLGESFTAGTLLSHELTHFFLTALDFRSLSDTDLEIVETSVISAIISLVLKLSESSFRPFYYNIFNWAFKHKAPKCRSITFYKLTCGIADSLKGLFVSFAHYFLKNAVTLLDENNKCKQEPTLKEAKALDLVNVILKALHTVFLHDSSHFINKERFDTLMQPLVDQLENELGGLELMQERISELVIPCLTQMAVSAADDTLWKQLNYQILLKTRHNLSQVRSGGVLAVCEIAKKLGEEFLPLLPETVPFLSELLEDEDENVEKVTQRVVQELESALGEQISKYF